MKISVVTVCLNSERTIRYTVDSFLRQTHPEKELLVIDGVSTDATLAIMRGYDAPEILVLSEPDKGIYDAMNKGLHRFSGDAVGFLNSDDCFHSDSALAHIASAFANNDVVYGGVRLIADHHSKRMIRKWPATAFSRRALRTGWIPPHPGFYIRREAAKKVGIFDTSYRIAADYDYMVRALLLPNVRVAAVPQTITDYQLGGASSNSLRMIWRQNLECLDVRKKWLGSGRIDAAFFLRPARRIGQFLAAVDREATQ